MKNFECNRIEDLVFNPSFRNWIFAGQPHENNFWADWEIKNSDKAKLIDQGKAIIHALQINSDTVSNDQVNEEISKLIEALTVKYQSV